MATEPNDRRRFLSRCTKILLATIGVLTAVPALGYVLAPLRRRRDAASATASFVEIGTVEDLPVGKWVRLPLELIRQDGWEKTRAKHAVWARRRGESEHDVTVLSTICPHLGCPISRDEDRSLFHCPCHHGLFDTKSGKVVGGPPPRSMDPLDFEIREGRLWVRWQDFKIGVAKRVPVQV